LRGRVSSFKNYIRIRGLRNILGLICASLILASFFLPWWKIYVFGGDGSEGWVTAYPHGVYGWLPWVGRPYGDSPLFVVFTAVYVACIVLAFSGSVLKGRKGSALFLTACILILLVTQAFHYRLSRACEVQRIPIEGELSEYYFHLRTGFGQGYYLASIAPIFGIASVLFAYAVERLRRRLSKKT